VLLGLHGLLLGEGGLLLLLALLAQTILSTADVVELVVPAALETESLDFVPEYGDLLGTLDKVLGGRSQ